MRISVKHAPRYAWVRIKRYLQYLRVQTISTDRRTNWVFDQYYKGEITEGRATVLLNCRHRLEFRKIYLEWEQEL